MRHLKKKIKSFNMYTSKEQFQSKTFLSNKLGAYCLTDSPRHVRHYHNVHVLVCAIFNVIFGLRYLSTFICGVPCVDTPYSILLQLIYKSTLCKCSKLSTIKVSI